MAMAMAMIYFGYEGMISVPDQPLHYMMTTKDVVVIGGGGGAALQQEEESDFDDNNNNMGTEEKEEAAALQLPYLDEGIIANILVKVHSAESLYNSLRYVCKPWNNIISHHPDIHLNFLLPSKSSPPCSIIIFQNTDNTSATYVSRTPEKVLEAVVNDRTLTTCLLKMGTREQDVGLEQHIDLTPMFKKLCIKYCCNGLVLATPEGPLKRGALCIVNPLTNHIVVLPPSPYKNVVAVVPIGFTFLPSTGKYKIVTMGHDRRYGPPHKFIQILTMSSPPPAAVGHCSSDCDDADPCRHWRLIEARELLYHEPPLEINGIYYWPQSPPGVGGYITSFDVASSRFYTTPHELFISVEEHRLYNGFMVFGGYLAFWSFRPVDGAAGEEVETDRRTFSVHVMEDSHKRGGGGEWKEVFSGVSIDLDIIKARWIIPCLSVGNGEVMIFSIYRRQGGITQWAYHFKSRRWLKVGNNLKEFDFLNFSGYLVKNSTPIPLDSLSPL